MAKILSLLPKNHLTSCKKNFKIINPGGGNTAEVEAPDTNETIVAKILEIRRVIGGLRTC